MPITTRSGRSTNSVVPKSTRRTTKIAMRKRRAASDDEDASQDCIVVHGSDSESESKPDPDSDSDSDNFVSSPKPAPKKKVIPTRAKAGTAKPSTTKKATTSSPAADPSTSASTLNLTQPLTTDPLVNHIAINDLLPFINRPAATRLEEQAANPKTAGKALNAFFVYKMAYHNRIRAMQNHLNSKIPKKLWFQNNYNKVAAQSWKLEDQAVKDFYSELSRQDEINRAKAFKNCREMIRVKRGPSKRTDSPASRAGRRWAKVLKSEQQKALPVGVVPGKDFTADDAVMEQQSQSVAVGSPVRSPLDIEMSLGSPSLVLPPPTPGLAEATEPIVDDAPDALFDDGPEPIVEDSVMKSPGLPKPAADEEAGERTLEILRKAFYLAAKDLEQEKRKEKAEETTIVEDMSHLALDDYERDSDHEDMSHFALEEHEREHEEMCELALEIHEREQEDMSHFALDDDEQEDEEMPHSAPDDHELDSEEEQEEESEKTASPEPEPRGEPASFTEYLNQDLEQVVYDFDEAMANYEAASGAQHLM